MSPTSPRIDEVFEALEEAIGWATAAGIPLQISHLNWPHRCAGRSEALLARIDKARAEGRKFPSTSIPTRRTDFIGRLYAPWILRRHGT
jgi:hypothetical protein